jgi:hypothetical protein
VGGWTFRPTQARILDLTRREDAAYIPLPVVTA